MSTGVPASIVEALGAVLSPSATGDAMALACGEQAPATRQYLTQCDLATLVIEVVTDSTSAKAPYVLSLPGPLLQRDDVMDVVCGVRPFMDSGAGQDLAVTAGKIERKPARIKVTATYASQCGLPGHPGIRVEPEGGDARICQPQAVEGSSMSFEAFRLPNAIERSMAMVQGGTVGTVARMLWDLVDNDAVGFVVVRSDSCGLRLAGSPVGGLAAKIRLYSEDEVSVTLKLPPLFGAGKTWDSKDKSSSGELQVTSKEKDGKKVFEKGADTSGNSHEVTQRAQLLTAYAEHTETETRSKDQTTTKETVKFGLHDSLAQQRGFDLTLTCNGRSVGREALKDFMETVELLSQAVDRFKALWAAGPGVKVAVGWSASWNLSFLQVDATYKGFRKVASGGARLHKRHEGSCSVTAVAGSATAGFGLLVDIRRLKMKVLVLDYRVTLTLAGTVKGGLKFSTDIKDGKEESQSPWSQPVGGEAKLTLAAVGTAEFCGRIIGCELAVQCGLSVKGELAIAAWLLEKIEIKRQPMVFTVKVWVGSTGEPDLVQTHELFPEKSLLQYPNPDKEPQAR